MGKPQVFKLPKQPTPPPLLRLEPFKGINLSVTPTQIDVHQSPEMLNFTIDERGSLNKRTGYERLFATRIEDMNLIKPFSDWNKHVNATVISENHLRLVATGTDQLSSFEFVVKPNTEYVFTKTMGTYQIFFTDNSNANVGGLFGPTVFTTPSNAVKARVETYNGGPGTFDYEEPSLVVSNPMYSKINGMYEFRKKDGTSVFLLAHGTKLYTQANDAQPVEIYNGLADSKLSFFTMNNKCYLMDGTNYLVYDGLMVSQIVPYVPHLTISGKPGDLTTGTLLEDFNLLGTGFKETFSGDGTGTVFQLSLKGLDATPLTIKVDEVVKVEGTHFTVDRVLGRITFTTPPSIGTNNVEIVAHKTYADFPNQIKKCTFNVLFGGSNDTRVFLGGNPDYGNQIWRLELQDPTYAPENGFYKVGSDSDKVQGFSKQYDYLVIEKERSKWLMHYEIQGGEPTFPLKPINDQVGTFARGTIQTVENNPVSLDRTGVYMLMASTVRDERNVQHISTNVDAQLLSEPNLDKAVSVDYDRKYWIAVNGNVYVLDYSLSEWYLYDNIHASQFYEMGGNLYFGSSTDGLIYRFKKTTELYPYNDDGQIITAYWLSKVMSFEADEQLKLVEKVFFSLNPATRTSADLYYVSNKKSRKFVKTTRKDLFHYSFMDYSLFSYGSREYPQEASNKVKAKKITYFQLEIRNEHMDEPLGLLSLGIKYIYQRMVK